ncbi:MAG: response regulator [Chitinophagaceae bacterium]|nr:MAG: response regulator [Chitinophagaceae bacterium]
MKRKHCIVIVDDDADDREIIRDAFVSTIEEQEYVFIENGDRLLEYLEQQAEKSVPSLIMLDLNMPGKDGRETLKEIKSNTRFQHIPTIVFTTSSSHRDKQTVYDMGANCFITKPDTFNKLIELTSCISKLWLP